MSSVHAHAQMHLSAHVLSSRGGDGDGRNAAIYIQGSRTCVTPTGIKEVKLATSVLLTGCVNGCTGPASTAGSPDPLSWVSRVE